MIVIHFFTLEDLISELKRDIDGIGLEGSGVVRVESTVRAVAVGAQGAIENREVSIHARAVVGSEVLAFMMRIGSVQLMHGEPFGQDGGAPDRLDDRRLRWERRIAEALSDEGLHVRPGLIDLGGAVPVSGRWEGEYDRLEAELEAEAQFIKGGGRGK